MLLAETKGFDWVAAWKAASVVLTGFFGVLGLLTDFKKDGSVTRWGYISLTGILVSTVLGTAAQLKESSDDAKRTLTILTGIQQELSPSVGDLKFETYFMLACGQTGPCKAIHNFDLVKYGDPRWIAAFGDHDNRIKFSGFINAPAPATAPAFAIQNDDQQPPYYATAQYWKNDYALHIDNHASNVVIESNDGTIHSLMDLDGKTFIVHGEIAGTQLSLSQLFVRGKTGEMLECADIKPVRQAEQQCTLHKIQYDY